MASAVPINFPTPTEGSIASYDWTDVAEGSGYVIFYGTETRTSTASTPILINTIIPSAGDAGQRFIEDNQTWSIDVGAFNLPKIVNGTAYVSCALKKGTGNTYITVKFQKVDAASATTDISSTIQSNTASTDGFNFLVPAALTKTHFKKGEKLRLSLGISDGTASKIWYDPTGTDGAAFRVYVPFDLDL